MIKTLRPLLVPSSAAACPCGTNGSSNNKNNSNNNKTSSNNNNNNIKLKNLHPSASDSNCVRLDFGSQAKVAAERDIDLNAKLLKNNSGTTNNNNHKKTKKSAVASWLKSAASSGSSSTSSNNSSSGPNTMDLLQLLAINALEFTAPASAAFFLQSPSSPAIGGLNNSTSSPVTTSVSPNNSSAPSITPSSNNSTNNSTTAKKNKQQQEQQQLQGNNKILGDDSSANNSSSTTSTTSSNTSTTTTTNCAVQQTLQQIRRQFVQLSGHPGCFAPAGPSTLWKKQAEGSYETKVYEYLSNSDDTMASVIPAFHNRTEWNGETFLEIEDLLTGFDHNPHVMDLKMGLRTFLESEVTNSSERSDLYQKMVKVDPSAPSEKEYAAKAVTKLRYMQFREEQSSTSSLGFRIEAIKFPNSKEPMSDLKTVKTESQVKTTMTKFLPTDPALRSELIERLKIIRKSLENSQFFKTHEVIGSSVLMIYDSHRVGAWIIDFAKTVQRPVSLSHRKPWQMGNHEDGYLIGLDNLIKIVAGAS